MFAAKFSVMRPIAGWPRGTPGMSRANSGPSARASRSISPACSAMRRKPSQRVSVPNSRMTTSTDSFAMSNSAAIIAANTAVSPPIPQRASAEIVATRKKPSQRRFNIALA